MREIKFRAWDKDGSRMYEVAKLDFWGDPDQASCDLAGLDEDGELVELFDIYLGEVEIMQYTGMNDKKGKEIYEGDILRDKFGSVGVVQYKTTWGAYCFSAKLSPDEDGKLVRTWQSSPFFNSSDRYIVVGNIYENPELIQEDEA